MSSTNNEQLQLAFDSRFLRTRDEVLAFDRALGEYASHLDPADLPLLYSTFEDDTTHHEVMFGLVHLIDEFPDADAVPAFLVALPDLMSHASGWAQTLMARAINNPVTKEQLTSLINSAPAPNAAVARQLLGELTGKKPKPVGLRAEEVLSRLAS